MSTLFKPIYRLSEICIKIPVAFFTETLNFVSTTRPQTAKAILRKKIKARDSILPSFKLYYKSVVIKKSMIMAKNKYMDQ